MGGSKLGVAGVGGGLRVEVEMGRRTMRVMGSLARPANMLSVLRRVYE